MQRSAITQLTAWKTSPNRKPLVIRGARQVGKTWLMKEFGRQEFKNFVSLTAIRIWRIFLKEVCKFPA